MKKSSDVCGLEQGVKTVQRGTSSELESRLINACREQRVDHVQGSLLQSRRQEKDGNSNSGCDK